MLIDMIYIKRWMEQKIEESFESNPVVILTGPRQVGKSTLLEHAQFLKGWRYLTLDDPDVLEQAKEDPKGLLGEDKPTIIDEAQRCPELLLTVKYFVDKTKKNRHFILSGSGNISLRRTPRETLAGRVKYLHLPGLNNRELRGELPGDGILDQLWNDREIKTTDTAPIDSLTKVVWRGSLPGVVLAPSDKIAWDRGISYIDTYIQRDIQDLVRIRHPENFRRLMEALAQATGWESVQEELSKLSSETRTNVSRYMSLLQDTGLLHEIKGYIFRSERSYRQAKYYWFDSGAACFLAGICSEKELKQNLKGRYFENYILQQIISWASTLSIEPDLFYWKLKNGGGELDFVVRSSSKLIGIEVKASDQIAFKDTKPLREFLKTHPEARKGIIIYTGTKIFPAATDIYAVPWQRL